MEGRGDRQPLLLLSSLPDAIASGEKGSQSPSLARAAKWARSHADLGTRQTDFDNQPAFECIHGAERSVVNVHGAFGDGEA